MPTPRGMLGMGSAKMGGGGKKPKMPPTTFGGGMGGALAGAAPVRPRPAVPMGGPRAAPGALSGGGGGGAGVGAFRKGGEAKKEEVKKHAKGGAVEHGDEKEDKKLFGKMIKEHDKEEVTKHARGGPVIGGHSTHGMRGREHPAEQGMNRGTGNDGHRGGMKSAGLSGISTKSADSKPRTSRQGSFK